MNTYVAFLKSINVGGNNILPMAELRSLAEGIGFTNVATYIQSGNCVFQTSETDPNTLSSNLSNAILKAKDFKPPVLILPLVELETALAGNPFNVDPSESNKVHFHFSLGNDFKVNQEEIDKMIVSSERLEVIGTVLYLYAPDGVGRSKLFARLPKLLSEDVTVMNLKTVMKIHGMAVT